MVMELLKVDLGYWSNKSRAKKYYLVKQCPTCFKVIYKRNYVYCPTCTKVKASLGASRREQIRMATSRAKTVGMTEEDTLSEMLRFVEDQLRAE